jgi:hypothetical protein
VLDVPLADERGASAAPAKLAGAPGASASLSPGSNPSRAAVATGCRDPAGTDHRHHAFPGGTNRHVYALK